MLKAHLQPTAAHVQHTAILHPDGTPEENDRDLGTDLIFFFDGAEIDMNNRPLQVVVLDILNECELLAGGPLDLKINKDVVRGRSMKQIGYGFSIDFEIGVLKLATVDDGGNKSLFPHAVDR